MADQVADFVHLRVHSNYSLAEGAIQVRTLPGLCADDGQPAVAVTDTNNMFGALDISDTLCAAGIQPIIGVQLGIGAFGRQHEDPGAPAKRPEPDQLVLLAQTRDGYRNLLKLVSKAHLGAHPGDEPAVSYSDLAELGAEIICLTGGVRGPLGRLLAGTQTDAATACAQRLKEIFGDRVYVEIQRHGLAEEEAVEEPLIDLAYALDLPLVATNECFFPTIEAFEAHDIFICIGAGAYVDDEERRRLTPEHRFKTASEMRDVFADLPEACDNTVLIAQRCAWMVEKIDPILPPFGTGRDEADELVVQATEGLEKRFDSHIFTAAMSETEKAEIRETYRERLDYEIGVIRQMGFPGYFLIVSDFIKWAKEQDIPVGPGRGSGAGSLVAYALTITDLDPLRFSLLFERFLNPDRVSMPDFDVDFCQDRRGEVIEYVQRKYGDTRVAQIITFGKLQAKAAVRDVGRVLQMPYGQVDRICKTIPGDPAKPIPLGQAIEMEPDLKRMASEDPQVDRLLSIARQVEGLYRNASTHAAGVVIGDRDLDELVPLYRDPRADMPVTQFNMKFVENAGLVKFDFLGLKTLTVIVKAVELMKQRADVADDFDIGTIPLDDAKSFELLSAAETVGVFQLESQGMMDVLRGLKPDAFEDIIAVVALYRPGPMDNIPSYIRRKHGEEEPDYMHDMLQPILTETFGILIYQEQVMQLAQIMAGYSLGAADLLRRAMGKKNAEAMEAERTRFVEGAEKNGVSRDQASDIFDKVAKFASYGFNKSHAAAYALVAYQTAWLKANYPVEFMAGLMSLDLHNSDKLGVFKQELARLKIDILPPDVNKSDVSFSVDRDGQAPAIRYALAAVRKVGGEAMSQLVGERTVNGPFKDLHDFASRLDARVVNKRLLENLIRAGALDCLHPNRVELLDGIDLVLGVANREQQARGSDQISMFGGDILQEARLCLPKKRDWGPVERLEEEREAIGFYLSAHPLDTFGKSLRRAGIATYAEVPAHLRAREKGVIRLAGTVISKQERVSAKGNKFAFIQLSDATGAYEVSVWAEALATYRDIIDSDKPLLLTVSGSLEEEHIRLNASRFEDLDQVVAGAAEGMVIRLAGSDPIEEIGTLLARQRRGRGLVRFEVDCGAGRIAELELPKRLQVGPALIAEIGTIPGVEHVEEI